MIAPARTPPIPSLFPAVRAAGTARRAVIDMRILRIGCHRCDQDATALSWPSVGTGVIVPTCPAHTHATRRPLPVLTNLDMAMLWLVADRPGASTADLASRGAPSWTLRGSGVVLRRLERIGLVSAGTARPVRAWYQTDTGRAISAFIRPGAPVNA